MSKLAFDANAIFQHNGVLRSKTKRQMPINKNFNFCAVLCYNRRYRCWEARKSRNTYNFEVADFHTYYVTESNILVHNKCPAGSPLPNEGLPNSTALRYDVEGNLYTAKTYGADGRVVARIDFQGKPHYAVDVGKSIIPHVHPIVYDLEIYYRELNTVSLQYYIGSLLWV